MMPILSSLAVVVISFMLLLTGWMTEYANSVAGNELYPMPVQYFVWAFITILLWAQPWARGDSLRTSPDIIRRITYGILILMCVACAYLFDVKSAFVGLGVAILMLIELNGSKRATS